MPRGRPRKKGSTARIQSAELINWALDGIEREIADTRNRLASLTAQAAQLRQRAGARAPGAVVAAAEAAPAKAKRRRRKFSAEERKKISERMTRRWAEWRKKNAK